MRGRNSDNTLIKQVLGWAPQTTLKEGLGITYKWIDEQVAKYGADTKALTTSTVVGQTMTDSCDMGKAAGKQAGRAKGAYTLPRLLCREPSRVCAAVKESPHLYRRL